MDPATADPVTPTFTCSAATASLRLMCCWEWEGLLRGDPAVGFVKASSDVGKLVAMGGLYPGGGNDSHRGLGLRERVTSGQTPRLVRRCHATQSGNRRSTSARASRLTSMRAELPK